MEPLRIHRTFGLTDHLRDMPIGRPTDIRFEDYSLNVVQSTISRLRKQGYKFKTEKVRANRWEGYVKLRVTRTA